MRLGQKEVTEKEFHAYMRELASGALTTDYPKMLYKAGPIGHNEHHHHGEPLKIAGQYECQTRIVADEDEELAALEQGWSTSPIPTLTPAKGGARGNPA